MQAEEYEHDEHRYTEEHVVHPDIAGVRYVHQGGGVKHAPDGLEEPSGGLSHGLGEPVEWCGDEGGGGFSGHVAHVGDDGDVADRHRTSHPS
ncbi:hypothetical protein [Corynebacterium glutamicum]|uniref:hypothetical protein n=1 Tax=Corynebacterium glutamicum TaxID=1718 RepID=UPI001C4E14DF|nr:hypothetical protein [Corynebacterium glutamicum]